MSSNTFDFKIKCVTDLHGLLKTKKIDDINFNIENICMHLLLFCTWRYFHFPASIHRFILLVFVLILCIFPSNSFCFSHSHLFILHLRSCLYSHDANMMTDSHLNARALSNWTALLFFFFLSNIFPPYQNSPFFFFLSQCFYVDLGHAGIAVKEVPFLSYLFFCFVWSIWVTLPCSLLASTNCVTPYLSHAIVIEIVFLIFD